MIDDDEELTVERRLGKLEGWTRGHQAVCDLRFLILCATIAAAGSILAILVNYGLSSLQDAQHQQTALLEQLLNRPH